MCCLGVFIVFFFFKQKTAYEMRISDWSSDVCSSDLYQRVRGGGQPRRRGHIAAPEMRAAEFGEQHGILVAQPRVQALERRDRIVPRPEERRLGKEGVITVRSRWWPYH